MYTLEIVGAGLKKSQLLIKKSHKEMSSIIKSQKQLKQKSPLKRQQQQSKNENSEQPLRFSPRKRFKLSSNRDLESSSDQFSNDENDQNNRKDTKVPMAATSSSSINAIDQNESNNQLKRTTRATSMVLRGMLLNRGER